MLNMQNVKDIEITEGAVRTIHDKDNRLIWGRLAYDTKYAGDTYQQTYSGKNLFDGEYVQYAVGGSLNNIWFSNASTRSAVVKCQPNTMYTITKFDPSNRFVVADYPSVPPSNMQINTLVINNTATTLTVTTNSDAEYLFIYVSGQNEEPRMQVELGSSSTSYEPYTGGIPAPNPGYPQDVQVVTGEQTVTIGDGVDSEVFTISLGSIELCKIGTYQDYIYKSGDDWYVHKACGSSLLGEFTWTAQNTYNSTTIKKMSTDGLSGVYLPPTNSSTTILAYCTHYQAEAEASVNLRNMGVSGRTNGNDIFIYDPDYNTSSSPSDFKTWLSNNSVALYYVLATPTDTKITDATLIGQLNAVHEWLTRYGYNATVTGNLPLIINQTNL